jgi:hypothetical protein
MTNIGRNACLTLRSINTVCSIVFSVRYVSGITVAAHLGFVSAHLETQNQLRFTLLFPGPIWSDTMFGTCSSSLQCEQLEDREVPATLFALNSAGRLLTLDSGNPGVIAHNVGISNLVSPGEKITQLDLQPGSNLLYGRSNLGRLYIISVTNGIAIAVGTPVPTTGSLSAMDFNPTTNQLQVVSNFGENITINPSTGTISSVGANLSYEPGDVAQALAPRLSGLSFTNSVPLASSTTLFGIDYRLHTLVKFVGSPSSGQLATVGSLGVNFVAALGFDITAVANTAFAALRAPHSPDSQLFSINLVTGAATRIGGIGTNQVITDIIVANQGTATTPGTTGLTTTATLSPGVAVALSLPPTATTTLSPGISPPFFTTPTPIPTSPLFPSLVQPLAPGTTAVPFSTTTLTAFSTTPNGQQIQIVIM